MLNQNQPGGATETINCNSWLASASSTAKPSGPTNPTLSFGSVDEPIIEEPEDDSLKWVADNLQALVDKYRDNWIVVKNRNVIETSKDLVDVLKKASKAGINKPLVLKMEQPPLHKWRTAF